jgi:hypothetical protein
MGKYMRKGIGAGKVAIMEVSQGALGARTRAKTLALVEQDRKLASSKSASSKQQHNVVVDRFHTTYLELRSRKLEKVVKEIERPVRGHSLTEGSNEDGRELRDGDGITALEDVASIKQPEVGELLLQAEDVGSSLTTELSPMHVDECGISPGFPGESGLSTPRSAPDGSRLRCLDSGVGDPVGSVNLPSERSNGESRAQEVTEGGVSPMDEGLSQAEVNYRQPEVSKILAISQ